MALVIIILSATNNYDDGDLKPNGSYLYVAIVYNTSISIALFALVLFYAATHDLLRCEGRRRGGNEEAKKGGGRECVFMCERKKRRRKRRKRRKRDREEEQFSFN